MQAKPLFDRLKDMVRVSATYNFETYARCPNVQVEVIEDFDSLGYDHWIMVLLVKSKVINITFQIHFLSQAARKLTSLGLSMKMDELSPEVCHQFMQEYCNLTIGTIKTHLIDTCVKEEDFSMEPSVPQKKPSYDEVNLGRDLTSKNLSDCWAFRSGDMRVVCASRIEILDANSLKKLTPMDISALSITKGGTVEFL